MKIDGMNFVNGFQSTNSIKKREKNKLNTSFKGHILTKDSYGRPVYKFFLPNSKGDEKLHLALLSKDKDGNYKALQTFDAVDMPKGYKSLYINADDYGVDENNLLGYRFTVNNQLYTDRGLNIDGYTVAVPLHTANPHRSRLMQHVLIDSFNIPNPKIAKRNHFNILGGTLNSVEAKIQDLADSGIGEIIGNPIFGQDNKSNHGYWTTNAYQITNNIGNYADFHKLMISIFNRGMGWTADGAFVNEGHEGIHVKDIQNWGLESPFVNMFETKDLENSPIRFGVLSKNEDVNKHIHIKLVNAPYKITFEKTEDGYKEKSVKNRSFDASKSTYIQLFDDRLASEEQMNDDKIFDVYAIKEIDDKYSISSSRDSVQPLHFRVKPAEVKINYEKYKEIKKIDDKAEFKDFLTQWLNFSLVNSNKDGGVSLWVGNNDISKKRFVIPELELDKMGLSEAKRKEVVASQYQVQDDTVQVVKYWTNEVSRLLTEYTTKELEIRVRKLLKNNENKSNENEKITKAKAYEIAIKDMIEKKLLPASAASVYEKNNNEPSALENMLTIDPYIETRMYKTNREILPKSVTEGLMSFPLETIEFGPDLTTVFAYPYIKNLAVDADSVGLSRFEMFSQGDEYYNKIPERYRETYKFADEVYDNALTKAATDILKDLELKVKPTIFRGLFLSDEGSEIFSLILPDIVKFLIISALAPDIEFDYDSDFLTYDVKKLQEVDLNTLNLQYATSPEDAARKLLKKIKSGVKLIPEDKMEEFSNYLADRIENMSSDSINVAKLIIDKTETGLDWRIDAAKDVGDWENKDAGRFNPYKNEDSIMDFWSKVNAGAQKYNANSFKIGEVTDWEVDRFKFINRSKFDTITDYNAFFSDLIGLYGQNDEGDYIQGFANKIRDNLNSYYKTGTADYLNFAHRFVGNHDKPRILHMLATNVSAFNMDKCAEVENVIKRGFESSKEFNELDGKYKTKIYESLYKLRNGHYTVNGVEKEFDSENFAIRPFDYTIEDVINEACATDKDFSEYVRNNQAKFEKIKQDALVGILKPAMQKYRSILLTMMALPGTPTLYAGDEFGQTGWETFCKNEKQENRNAVRWDWAQGNGFEFIKKQYEDVFRPLMKIRSVEAGSALVNGATQILSNQNLRGFECNDDSRTQAISLYRYNDKTDAIAVLHGLGFGYYPTEAGRDASLEYISLDGLGAELPVGTIYADALNEKSLYKVVNEEVNQYYRDKNNDIKSNKVKKLVIKKLDENGNTIDNIPLGNAGLILLRKNDFSGKQLSFKGRLDNPNVALANTKYNFKYMNK